MVRQKIQELFSWRKLKKEVRYLLNQKQVRQTLLNYSAHIGSIIISIGTVTLIVQALGSKEYGKVGLIITIIQTISVFVGFGFFQAYARLLLKEEDKETQKKIIGIGVLLYASQVILLWILTLASLPLISLLYNDPTLTQAIFIISGISSFSLFLHFFTNTTRSLNHMTWQAIQRLIQPAIYLLLIIGLLSISKIGYIPVLIASYLTTILTTAIYLLYTKPHFKGCLKYWNAIVKEKKAFGFHVYIGKSVEKVTYNLDNIMLGMYLYEFVALYTLGMKLMSPILNFTNFFTNAALKKFYKVSRIPSRVFIYNTLWTLGIGAIILMISKPLILWLWGEEFLSIRNFLWLLIIYVFSNSIYYTIYMFLYAKGIGKEQQKYYYIRAGVNLGGNILLIPIFGVLGAVLATVVSSLSFLIGMIYEYYRYCNTHNPYVYDKKIS